MASRFARPVLSASDPQDNAQGVRVDLDRVVLTFSTEMAPRVGHCLGAASSTADEALPVAFDLAVWENTRTWRLPLAQTLQPATTYELVLMGLTSTVGGVLARTVLRFTTLQAPSMPPRPGPGAAAGAQHASRDFTRAADIKPVAPKRLSAAPSIVMPPDRTLPCAQTYSAEGLPCAMIPRRLPAKRTTSADHFTIPVPPAKPASLEYPPPPPRLLATRLIMSPSKPLPTPVIPTKPLPTPAAPARSKSPAPNRSLSTPVVQGPDTSPNSTPDPPVRPVNAIRKTLEIKLETLHQLDGNHPRTDAAPETPPREAIAHKISENKLEQEVHSNRPRAGANAVPLTPPRPAVSPSHAHSPSPSPSPSPELPPRKSPSPVPPGSPTLARIICPPTVVVKHQPISTLHDIPSSEAKSPPSPHHSRQPSGSVLRRSAFLAEENTMSDTQKALLRRSAYLASDDSGTAGGGSSVRQRAAMLATEIDPGVTAHDLKRMSCTNLPAHTLVQQHSGLFAKQTGPPPQCPPRQERQQQQQSAATLLPSKRVPQYAPPPPPPPKQSQPPPSPPVFEKPDTICVMEFPECTFVTLSKSVLHFGSQSEPVCVDKELTDMLALKHAGGHGTPSVVIQCRVPYDDRFELKVDAGEGGVKLKKGKEAVLKFALIVKCTMTFERNVELTFTEKRSFARQFGTLRASKNIKEAKESLEDTRKWSMLVTIKVATELSTKLDYEQLIFTNHIGNGGMASVWCGMWRETQVAIKYLKEQDPDEIQFKEFEREVAVMTKLRSSYIVNFIGAVAIRGKLCLVTEFMPLGSVLTVLHGKKKLSWLVKLKLCCDAAHGMAFLHNNNLVHRDLKPDNLLCISLSAHAPITCKVADFGTSKGISFDEKQTASATEVEQTRDFGTDKGMTKGIGTPLYMAPEVLANCQYGPKSDVFSYASTLWQIQSEEEPYSDMHDVWEISDYVTDGKACNKHYNTLTNTQRLKFKPDAPADFVSVVNQCWSHNPDNRPSFSQIIVMMSSLVQKAEQEHEACKARKRKDT
eukprot:TRINITY_DN856_c0_g1_i5.p1 TRINITY_DN856_c0_g1~~TRINITY_DN856_c0_g1_i5.p1  ORF type:complete len:1032 (-),score=200.26 TRINITY_DN856_c0_g1_i5:127-3222(-)